MSSARLKDSQKPKLKEAQNDSPVVRKYYPRCSCGTTKQKGVCPHGCDAFCRPSRTVKMAGKGREAEKEYGTYLTPKEIDDGMMAALAKRS
jgi:hypothetical protein